LPVKEWRLKNPPFHPCQRVACIKNIVRHWGRDCPNQDSPFVDADTRLVEIVGTDPPIFMMIPSSLEEFLVQLDDDGVNIYYQRIDTMPVPILGDTMADLFFSESRKSPINYNQKLNSIFYSKVNKTNFPKYYTDEDYEPVSVVILNEIFAQTKLHPTIVLASPKGADFTSTVTKVYGMDKSTMSDEKWVSPDPFAKSWKNNDSVYFIHAEISRLDEYLHKFRSSRTPQIILITPYDEKHWITLQILLCMSFLDPTRLPHNSNTFRSGKVPKWANTGVFFLSGDYSKVKLFQVHHFHSIFHSNENPPKKTGIDQSVGQFICQ
jgi:hypothetical protein